MDRNSLILQVLKDRQLLQALSQVSFTYAQINRNFKRFEEMGVDELIQVQDAYKELFVEVARISDEFEYEYNKRNSTT